MSLKDLRKERGLTQRQAADRFGIKYRTYQNYENGVTSPDMDTAATFARYFNCTIGDLFDLQEGEVESLESLEPSEQELVGLFRKMNKDGREALMAVANGLAEKFAK